MAIPLIVFVVLMWLGREELGFKGILICLLICVGLLFGCALLNISPYTFTALLALLDIILLLTIFGGDIYIR